MKCVAKNKKKKKKKKKPPKNKKQKNKTFFNNKNMYNMLFMFWFFHVAKYFLDCIFLWQTKKLALRLLNTSNQLVLGIFRKSLISKYIYQHGDAFVLLLFLLLLCYDFFIWSNTFIYIYRSGKNTFYTCMHINLSQGVYRQDFTVKTVLCAVHITVRRVIVTS